MENRTSSPDTLKGSVKFEAGARCEMPALSGHAVCKWAGSHEFEFRTSQAHVVFSRVSLVRSSSLLVQA